MAELVENHDVEVEWLPFELRPEPVPLPDLNGPEGARFRAGWARGVVPLAAQLGVEMHEPPLKPRSRLAHEAAEFARANGGFEAMRQAIFRGYFVENRDISDPEVLAGLGESVGLDGEALREALASRSLAEPVEQLESISRQFGVSAVPTIVIGGLVVEGVRPYAVLRRVLEEAERREQAEPPIN